MTAYIPSAYVEPGYSWLRNLTWPRNKWQIAIMGLDLKQKWLLSLDPQELIDLGSEKAFVEFWRWAYIMPLQVKRILYKLRFW